MGKIIAMAGLGTALLLALLAAPQGAALGVATAGGLFTVAIAVLIRD